MICTFIYIIKVSYVLIKIIIIYLFMLYAKAFILQDFKRFDFYYPGVLKP